MPTLSDLNTARSFNGKAPLKSWKNSKQALNDAYQVETELSLKNNGGPIKAVSSGKKDHFVLNPEGKAAVAAAKATTTDKVVEKAPAKKVAVAKDTKSVNVAEIAKALGLNPKVARAKLRKLNVDRSNVKSVRKALTK